MATGSLEKTPSITQQATAVASGSATPVSPSSSDDVDEADKMLEAMGYTPVFKREFSSWSSFSFAMSISGVYGSLMSTWIYGLQAGGAAAIMWSWVLGGAGALALALSLAELSSAYPSSGAMYFTLKFLAPDEYVPVLCWISGYINLVGTITGSAATEYASSQMLLAAVSIASDFAYTPTTHHVVAVMALLAVAHASVNSLPTVWLNRLASGYVVFHVSVLVGACATLLAQQRAGRHDVAYAFTDFQPSSGWSPPGFAFLFGCLTPAWIMTSADSTARIAEEAKDPARIVPKAIANATTFTYVVGFLFNLVLVLCMGDPLDLINSPSGQPVAQLFFNAMGRVPAIFFTLSGFVVMNLVAIPGLQSGSRTIFAFARDDLLPLSHIWRRISPRSGTPIAAVWLYAALEITVNLLGLAGDTAIGAVFNVCTVALNLSYAIPLVCKLRYGRFERGPWHLSRRTSVVLNVVAVAWNAFMAVIFFLPTRLPVTAENMNYALVVFFVVVVFSVGFWFTHGRHFYTGPRTTIQPQRGYGVAMIREA
ncbi:amino acid/polyamine transporter I [Lasiosphaeria miniovina]|uniref:Amino acid/polyamine transporter I n=1 Tax=Lasiosphaeria miniovina TaxID=1954250 RepID=A0AA40BHX8_9PEZI|nr:amino acid/polyamine transporter I [Lasiosphaeria miniovina]KAK0734546.1 amino acid/polyamine transporter I [Lasiosphaeria miniovina]